MITPPLRRARTLAVLAFAAIASSAFAHNLDTTSTALQYSPDFIETMKTRAAAGQSLIQPGDEFWVSMKTTPGPGTTTGVGGYMTFYVPGGYQVADAAYVNPSRPIPVVSPLHRWMDSRPSRSAPGRSEQRLPPV